MDPVGTIRREDHGDHYTLWALTVPSWLEEYPRWSLLYSTGPGTVVELWSGRSVEELTRVVGTIPDTPAANATKRNEETVMRFRARKTLRFGPFVWHWTHHGPTSWGLRFGRWTWNAKTRRHTVDTPGPGSVTFGEKP